MLLQLAKFGRGCDGRLVHVLDCRFTAGAGDRGFGSRGKPARAGTRRAQAAASLAAGMLAASLLRGTSFKNRLATTATAETAAATRNRSPNVLARPTRLYGMGSRLVRIEPRIAVPSVPPRLRQKVSWLVPTPMN